MTKCEKCGNPVTFCQCDEEDDPRVISMRKRIAAAEKKGDNDLVAELVADLEGLLEELD